jgi:hypothetical protein
MRSCGDCQACCRVLPISEIGKKAGARCSNQKFKVGCKVHGTPSQPTSCWRWSCWWLLESTFDLPRPDRAGYVVDPIADFVVLGEDIFAGKRVPALQVWADPHRPEAWRNAVPWIKSFIGDSETVAIIRFDSRAAVVLVPPQLSSTGDWGEVDSRMMGEQHRAGLRTKMVEESLAKQKDVAGGEVKA